jgi:hypothetical protein
MDDATRTHTPTTPAADLVRYYLTLLLASFALPESAEQLRAATLAWATAAELFRLYLPLAAPQELSDATVAMDAADDMARGRTDAAVARLAARTGLSPAAWLRAMDERREAPCCERCGEPVTALPGAAGEAFAAADGAVRVGEAWVCLDCVAAHPRLVDAYPGLPGIVRSGLDARRGVAA